MKRGHTGGYTIVEVMIVLAVTSALFISTAAMLSGKQGRTEFEQGVNDMVSKLQSIMSEVASGYYPNEGFTCTPNSPPAAVGLAVGGSVAPGSHKGCIFLGKAIYAGSASTTHIEIVSAIGRQYSTGTTDVANIPEAGPNYVPSSSMVDWYDIKYDLALDKIKDLDVSPEAGLTGIALYAELGTGTQLDPITGSRAIHLYGIKGTLPGAITSVASTNYVDLPRGVVLCLKYGTDNNNNAEITIGASGGVTNIYREIDTGVGRCA